jgi:hypothetical protein
MSLNASKRIKPRIKRNLPQVLRNKPNSNSSSMLLLRDRAQILTNRICSQWSLKILASKSQFLKTTKWCKEWEQWVILKTNNKWWWMLDYWINRIWVAILLIIINKAWWKATVSASLLTNNLYRVRFTLRLLGIRPGSRKSDDESISAATSILQSLNDDKWWL